MDSYLSSFSGSVLLTEWTAWPACAGQCSPLVLVCTPDTETPPLGERPRQGAAGPAVRKEQYLIFTIFSWIPKTTNEKQILKEATLYL